MKTSLVPLLTTMLLATIGCTELDGDKPAVPTGGSDVGQVAGTSGDDAPAHTPPRLNPAAPAAPQPMPTSTTQPRQMVRLSAGVGLPQTLPTGTSVVFSVDYQLVARPEGSGRFEWVIERSQGEPFRKTVELQESGTLTEIGTGWPPGQEPYNSHIEWVDGEGKATRVSESVPMT